MPKPSEALSPGRWRGRGVAAVELALLMPLLCLMLLGVLEFSFALYNKSVLAYAAREGARAGIVLSTPKLTAAQIQQLVMNRLQGALVDPGGLNSSPTVSVTQSTPAAYPNPLRVTVSMAYRGLLAGPMFGSAFNQSITISSTVVMVNE